MASTQLEEKAEIASADEKIVMIINPDAEFWLAHANELANRGENDQALVLYDRALESAPQYSKTWYCKGNALDTMGRLSEALECYNNALKCDPHDAETWYNKGMTLKKAGRDNEGMLCIQHGLSLALGQ